MRGRLAKKIKPFFYVSQEMTFRERHGEPEQG